MFFRINQGADHIRLEISSEKRAIKLAHEAFHGFLEDHGTGNAVPVYLVLDELLHNAVKHGNASDPGRSVRCRLSMVAPGFVELAVADEGPGFAHDETSTTFSGEPPTVARRGLFVARALSDSLGFSDGGRCVTALIPLLESIADDGALSGAMGDVWPETAYTAAGVG
ncbi:MAG: ATP-binding protein [bacterium]|nr:ATP-binding protein [bacterium]